MISLRCKAMRMRAVRSASRSGSPGKKSTLTCPDKQTKTVPVLEIPPVGSPQVAVKWAVAAKAFRCALIVKVSGHFDS
jgi:hypothetical protein